MRKSLRRYSKAPLRTTGERMALLPVRGAHDRSSSSGPSERRQGPAGPRSGNVLSCSGHTGGVLVVSGREVGNVSVEDDVPRRTPSPEGA